MDKKKITRIPITIHLTPEQIKEIIRQLRSKEQDWMDDPEIIAMLEDLAQEGEQEFNEGRTMTL
ncbi:MAG: hypothetical protein K8T10_15690 [Candidatus Eremiobacteraeota bacterium]|nr:hypothetical protein [Candidatus Eremiobacteraeota bacterium]